MQLAGHGFVYHFPDDFDDRAAVNSATSAGTRTAATEPVAPRRMLDMG